MEVFCPRQARLGCGQVVHNVTCFILHYLDVLILIWTVNCLERRQYFNIIVSYIKVHGQDLLEGHWGFLLLARVHVVPFHRLSLLCSGSQEVGRVGRVGSWYSGLDSVVGLWTCCSLALSPPSDWPRLIMTPPVGEGISQTWRIPQPDPSLSLHPGK